ncbi:MAG: VOC family protein [Oscillospiraceae bacterium]|nr:VOC family protein [Oscillospiraceae bacterium]
MNFKLAHSNINVSDMEKSLAFYKNALGMEEIRRHKANDGSFELAFIFDGSGAYQLELTWLRDKEGAYDLGDNESHIAFVTDDMEAAHEHHEKMGCICYENQAMGLYFIEDPDGYWIEIMPNKTEE